MKFRKTVIGAALATTALLTGCTTDATRVSENLAKGAEAFEINRRVVLVNGITDNPLLVVEGRCSFDDTESKVNITCKIGDNEYKRHSMGLSDNVTYVVEQLETADASVYHYRVEFKPENIIPDIRINTGKQ